MNGGIHPVTLAAARILLGAGMFLVYILVTDPKKLRVERRDWLFFLLFGLLTVAVFHFSFNYAIYYTGVATASILLYTAPAFVTLLSIFFFGEKPTVKRLAALVLTLLGCFAISRAAGELAFNRAGILFGLASGFAYGLWSILGKKGLVRYSAEVINFYNLLIGGIFLLIAALFIAGPSTFRISAGGMGGILLMTFLTTFIPYNLYVNGMNYLSASKASILANFELVIAVVLSRLLFREPFTLFKMLGFAAIGAGLLLIISEDYRPGNGSRRV